MYRYFYFDSGLACSIAGMACSFNYRPLNPPMSPMAMELLRPEITIKVNDLTQNLNK